MPWKEDETDKDDLLEGLYTDEKTTTKTASIKQSVKLIPIQRSAALGFKDLGYGSFIYEGEKNNELKITSGSFWNVVEKDGEKYLQKTTAERTPLTETIPELVENDVKTKYDQQKEQRELSVSEEADLSLVDEDLKKKGLASVVEAAKIEISDSTISAIDGVIDYIAGDAEELGATSTKELVELALDAGRLHDRNPAADQEIENLISEHGYEKVFKAVVKRMKTGSLKKTTANMKVSIDCLDMEETRLELKEMFPEGSIKRDGDSGLTISVPYDDEPKLKKWLKKNGYEEGMGMETLGQKKVQAVTVEYKGSRYNARAVEYDPGVTEYEFDSETDGLVVMDQEGTVFSNDDDLEELGTGKVIGASKKVIAFDEGDDVEDDGGNRLRVIATGSFTEMKLYDESGTIEDLAPQYRVGTFVACEDIDTGQSMVYQSSELEAVAGDEE